MRSVTLYLLPWMIAGVFLCFPAQLLAVDKNYKKKLDVRVLVDVSSKMKLHDQEQYRQSALDLFIKLLPAKATAGIWMFDDLVTELMPASNVGLSWKALAQKSTQQIHSSGEYSNIEKALAVASLDWVEKDEKTSRHIILITDGQVNISTRKRLNEASKQRILNFQLNSLNELGVSIHTVGLSEKAELSLLEELSVGTGGWYDRVRNIEHLEKTLFRVNRHLVQKNNIPLLANKFQIDSSIREFTAVVFRKKKFSTVQLDDPEGMDFDVNNKRRGVKWFRGKRHDIVTVTNPMPGEWRIIAPADPGSEVIVTTNLEMVVDSVPQQISSGQATRIRSLMVDRGKLVINGNFLDAIQVSLALTDREGELYKYDMERDMITGGYYFVDIGKELIPGTYKMLFTAKGNTFERRESALIKVGPKIVPSVVSVPADFKKVLQEAGLKIPKDKLYDPKILIEFEQELLSLEERKRKLAEAALAAAAAEIEEESGWLMTSVVLVLINLLLAAAGFFGFKFYKKKVALSDDALISKLAG